MQPYLLAGTRKPGQAHLCIAILQILFRPNLVSNGLSHASNQIRSGSIGTRRAFAVAYLGYMYTGRWYRSLVQQALYNVC